MTKINWSEAMRKNIHFDILQDHLVTQQFNGFNFV
jgi:serine/threonine protein kinase